MMRELVKVNENIKKCPHCQVLLKRKRYKLQLATCRNKKEVLIGEPWYVYDTICPKCGKSKDGLVAELRGKEEKEIPKCPKCRIKMSKCQFRHDLMRGKPDEKDEGTLIATTFVSNPCWRCKKCGFKRRARFGLNLFALSVDNGTSHKYFPFGWQYNTYHKEVWEDI